MQAAQLSERNRTAGVNWYNFKIRIGQVYPLSVTFCSELALMRAIIAQFASHCSNDGGKCCKQWSFTVIVAHHSQLLIQNQFSDVVRLLFTQKFEFAQYW